MNVVHMLYVEQSANDEEKCFRYFMTIQSWNSSLLRCLVLNVCFIHKVSDMVYDVMFLF